LVRGTSFATSASRSDRHVASSATNSSNYSIATKRSKCKKNHMSATGKRTVQVNVRLSEDDFELIRKAAAKLWPDAVLSNSGIVLGLARLAAKQTLETQKKPRGI